MYKRHQFVYRPLEEVTADIDRVAAIRDEITAASKKLGLRGQITRELGSALLAEGPDLVGTSASSRYQLARFRRQNGFPAGRQQPDHAARELVAMLQHLRRTLPSLVRVTSYARSKTLAQRKPEELRAIREADWTASISASRRGMTNCWTSCARG